MPRARMELISLQVAAFATAAVRARASPGRDAAKAGSVAALQKLLDDGWQPKADRDRRGTSALHYAAGHGFTSACTLLVDAQTLPVDDTNIERATPLHFAVAGMRSRRARGEPNGFGTGGHAHVAQALLERGADPAASTVDGNAVVHWAAWAGGVPVLRLLLEARAADVDLSVLNERGCSVAHWAASSGALASCVYLANVHGVDFSVPNHEGATPLTKAIYHAKPGVVRWLVDGRRHHPDELADAKAMAERLAQRRRRPKGTGDEATRRAAISQWLRTASPGRSRVRLHRVRCCDLGDAERPSDGSDGSKHGIVDRLTNGKPSQLIGLVAGSLYLGNFIAVMTIGVLKRFDLISLPPINSLITIANNAMDAEIAAGTLPPLLATAWSFGFWIDLLRQFSELPGEQAASFVSGYCTDHAALCVGL